jgi:hypothetical protein
MLHSFQSRHAPKLHLNFGAVEPDDRRRGISTDATVTLRREDVPVLVAHLLEIGEFEGSLFCELPRERDGGGGEELPVPTISQTGLARMQPIAGRM